MSTPSNRFWLLIEPLAQRLSERKNLAALSFPRREGQGPSHGIAILDALAHQFADDS